MRQESGDLDRQLKQLAIVAQQHQPKSLERRLALNRLCIELLKPGCLSAFTVPSEFDRSEIYQEALSLTMLEVCQKIDSYKVEKEVRQWCNFILKMRQYDVIKTYKNQGVTAIPRFSKHNPPNRDNVTFSGFDSSEDLENLLIPEERRSASMELRQLIEEDPDSMFSCEFVRDRPDVNFKVLAIAHIWDDRSWSDIAEEFDLHIQTVYGFFKNKMVQFCPYFRDYFS